MDNDRMLIDKLRQELLLGRITYDDVVKRLTKAIENEYLKESPNVDFISACEHVLWKIETEGKQEYVSVSDRYLGAIEQHVKVAAQVRMKRKPATGFAKRIALVCAASAILILFSQGAIHFEWFTQQSSSDEQQYIIQGHEITVNLIRTCIAEHNEYDFIKTSSFDDLCSFLGFSPSVASPQAFGVDTVLFEAYIEPSIIMVNALYESEPGDAIAVLTTQYYTDADALFMFEQDITGELILVNGNSVYTSTNMGRTSFSWMSNSTVYKLAGTFDNTLGLSLVHYLIEGDLQ